MSDKIWFITGCSTGLGRALAERVLERGERAVLTARDPAKLADLTAPYGDRALALGLDVTDTATIDRALSAAEEKFGRIDVLVNNAGYGYFSAIEAGEDAEIRRQFETNVFGLYALTQRVLPAMRARRSGHIINVSSVGGLVAFPATGYYHASKFAVEAFSESLSKEVAALGIKVTIVEPGAFRTDWAGRSMVVSKTTIDDYDDTVGLRVRTAQGYSGTQPGDPVRAADAMIKAVEADQPPLRLLLGSDAYRLAQAKLDALQENFEAWKDVSLGTDFPKD